MVIFISDCLKLLLQEPNAKIKPDHPDYNNLIKIEK